MLSEEHKRKVSIGRKRYLKENPDKHPWKNKNKKNSIPCEKVKVFLRNKGIQFVEEWQPLTNRFFSIDIAFPDIRLGIEINGNQHYNRDGTLKEYYQKRHDEIAGAGWNIIELHYSIAFNLEKLMDVLSIKEQPDYSEYFRILQDRLKNKEEKKAKIKPRGVTAREQNDKKWVPYKQKITESNIDFSKFGWVNKVSEILKISPQKVKDWMKRYLPDFYEQKCFKRKTPHP